MKCKNRQTMMLLMQTLKVWETLSLLKDIHDILVTQSQ